MISEALQELNNCRICPRNCGINRNAGQRGYCGRGPRYEIASICRHKGEEPAISGSNGICNVFFTGCNLRCIYCQNHQISRYISVCNKYMSLTEVTAKIIEMLDEGIELVGFVSPSHFTPHVKAIIRQLNEDGYRPVTVYNTNGFDRVEIIRSLEGLIDVYLPDFKYINGETSLNWSDSLLYPEVSKAVLLEMYRQKGSTVVVNENGQAVTGLIIRHLVLPGKASESIKALEWIANELSPGVYISLMSQYYPTGLVSGHPILGRTIFRKEYDMVVKAMEDLGFYRGWIQDFESPSVFRPDFQNAEPFKD